MYVVQLARVHGEPPVLESGEARSSGVKKKRRRKEFRMDGRGAAVCGRVGPSLYFRSH